MTRHTIVAVIILLTTLPFAVIGMMAVEEVYPGLLWVFGGFGVAHAVLAVVGARAMVAVLEEVAYKRRASPVTYQGPDLTKRRSEMARWLGWSSGKAWGKYELSVDLASDIALDRMLLEIDLCTPIRRAEFTGIALASAYFDKVTKLDRLEIHYGEDALVGVRWEDLRESLVACQLNLVQQGMPVLSSCIVQGLKAVRFYRDGEVVGTMWADRFVNMLDDFFANQSDRIEEGQSPEGSDEGSGNP